MKKNYFFLSLFLLLFGVMSASAGDVVTSLGKRVGDLSEIKVGDKLLLYCNGSTDSTASDFGTREAFMREVDDYRIWICRDLQFGKLSSSDYIWTVLSYEADGEDSYKISLQSPRGNFLPTFIDDIDTYGQWARWMGRTVTSDEGEAGIFTISITENDSLFYFQDENGVFFNGQDIHSERGHANFVGWNSPGENSLYRIYLPTVESKETVVLNLYHEDLDGNEIAESRTIEAIPGDSIQATEVPEHSFVKAINYNTDEEVEFPYVVTDSDADLLLIYEVWPYLSIVVYDEATEEILWAFDGFVEKGSRLELPDQEELGIGYSIITEGYEDYVVTEDAEIVLYARQDASNLPFTPTTVTNGEFAADTKWYVVKVRGTKSLKYDVESEAVLCVSASEVNDSLLWAFTGNLKDGFQIYNKACGAGSIIYSGDGENGTQVFMTPVEDAVEPNTFDLNTNGDGFCFSYYGNTSACLNDFAGDGVLKYWTDGNSPTDVGSRFYFDEFTKEMEEALKFMTYIETLNTEGCVGGYKSEDLAALKAAYNARNLDACEEALIALEGADTIAFDRGKTYAIVSAYKDFIVRQNNKTYAMKAVNDTLAWTELDESDKEFHFGFIAVSDTTDVLANVSNGLAIGSFRFGSPAVLVDWAENDSEDGSTEVGVPAGFQMVKSDFAPAAYRFKHVYVGSTFITLAAMTNQIGIATGDTEGGVIGTYNTVTEGFANYWRLKPMGEFSNIENTIVTNPGKQTNVIYDLSGRRVQKAVKGLYIINGKKVYVK